MTNEPKPVVIGINHLTVKHDAGGVRRERTVLRSLGYGALDLALSVGDPTVIA